MLFHAKMVSVITALVNSARIANVMKVATGTSDVRNPCRGMTCANAAPPTDTGDVQQGT